VSITGPENIIAIVAENSTTRTRASLETSIVPSRLQVIFSLKMGLKDLLPIFAVSLS
jgi:hypothetical protein